MAERERLNTPGSRKRVILPKVELDSDSFGRFAEWVARFMGNAKFLVWMTVVVNLLFALAAILKGRVVLGVVGVFVPLVALVGAVRLARPGSFWAHRWYRAGSRRRGVASSGARPPM